MRQRHLSGFTSIDGYAKFKKSYSAWFVRNIEEEAFGNQETPIYQSVYKTFHIMVYLILMLLDSYQMMQIYNTIYSISYRLKLNLSIITRILNSYFHTAIGITPDEVNTYTNKLLIKYNITVLCKKF